tara:strand:+ start:37716 stop:39026 length:1311 start_codon:yes stop_codon:yes gene_type:complete
MALAAGDGYAVALNGKDGVYLWGSLPKMPASQQLSVPCARQVAAGCYDVAVVTTDGQLFMSCCGNSGTLLLGRQTETETLRLVQPSVFAHVPVLMVACGSGHSAVVTLGGCVYTSGHGSDGQLGDGCNTNRLSAVLLPRVFFDDEPVEMVTCGDYFTAAITSRGVFTWGANDRGQLGHNSRDSSNIPKRVDHGTLDGANIVFAAAGADFTTVVSQRGRLFAWGCNRHGQIGIGNSDAAEVPHSVCACEGTSVIMAACGKAHTLLVVADGGMWAAGRGQHGQLGLGDTRARREFERIPPGAWNGERVVAAAAGPSFSVAMTDLGHVFQWGMDFGTDPMLHESRLLPQRRFSNVRFGSSTSKYEGHMLAFSAGMHVRLGVFSPLQMLAGEESLARIIGSFFRRQTMFPWTTLKYEGLLRLMGEGLPIDTTLREFQENQ